MKKLSIILAVVMCVAALMSLVACGGTSSEYEINYDIDLGQKRDLSVLMPYSGYEIGTVNNSLTAQTIERLTGYKTTYTQLPAADASKTLNNELMDKRPYDAIKLTKDQFADLVKDDMLVDLTDALKKFAPDMLSAISEESWGVVTVNGKIYGIPERASSDNIENPIVFNNDLMLQCNLELPTTLDEFENVLKVLTEKIGRPALTFDRYTPLVYAISAAFGIYTDWQEYTVDGTTQVLYYMNAPRYKDYVDYMHGLYSKGYIDMAVGTNKASDCINNFVNDNAAAYACSLWTVPSIVNSMRSTGKINEVQAGSTLDEYLTYLRALKSDANAVEKVYRSGGYSYIVGVPYYMAENVGYVLDWMNSKIKDTDTEHNFREIVLGTENVHWTYSEAQGYLPAANFSEKDDASYYLTGTNESKYTDYWKARVRKQPELFRAWSLLMTDADAVGVHNITDYTPPIADYNANRSAIEEYAQDQMYIMMKDGTGKLAEYQTKLNGQQGCAKATEAVNAWYKANNK